VALILRRLQWSASFAVVALATIVNKADGQETAAYPNGTSGLKAGTVPPPGHYWLMYNRLYQADRLRDADGDVTTGPSGQPLGFDVTGYANVHRFLHVTEHEICGANYSWNFVVPFVIIDTDIAAYGVHDTEFKFGDLNIEPFVMEWHKPRYDFGIVYGLFAPTAERSDVRAALPGKKFWTNYIGPAGTYYFDDERTWSISFLSRYEISSTRQDKDIRAGQNISFEWGLARNFEGTLDVGVSGYCSWQTTLDSGRAVNYENVHDRVFAAGPEINYFSTRYKLGYNFRAWWEFGARDRTEGEIITLTLVKPF
jgi:hypothetical protein